MAILQQDCRLVVSVPLFLEYEAVLSREPLTQGAVADFLDGLLAVSDPVRVDPTRRPRLTDPGDEMVLETAVDGGAQYLATFNTRHFQPAAEWGISVLLPRELLKIVRIKHEKE